MLRAKHEPLLQFYGVLLPVYTARLAAESGLRLVYAHVLQPAVKKRPLRGRRLLLRKTGSARETTLARVRATGATVRAQVHRQGLRPLVLAP